jgi:long-chain acyl-CoA synthetase
MSASSVAGHAAAIGAAARTNLSEDIPVTFWQVFDATASQFASRTAVEIQRADRLDRWTYGDLSAAAIRIARWLASQGVRAGDRCAIFSDNDADWCAAYLGILRLGAIVVPLDTNYSAAQVATIVADATPRLLFTNERLQATARDALAARADVAIADLHHVPDAPFELAPAGTESSATAVILYTSGTTSDPKGVVLSHGNLIAERDAAFRIVSVTEADSVLGVLPLFHALAQLANLLLPFAVGARVVFLETVNSTELVRALAGQRITIFACVPQFFYLIHQRVMHEVARGGALKRLVFRSLLAVSFALRRAGVNVGPRLFGRVHAVMGRQMRLFVTGGSKFDPAVGRDLYALGFTILQAYGLTETTGAATINSPDEAYLDTVGRVLPGHELKTLPSDDEELDGEIAIKGPIVMQGYFNRPDATAAVMRDGWFLTGDLGRVDANGRLTITGRKKEVIVLASGKNIYPEEIEGYYRQSAFVKEICVLGLTSPDDPTSERLYAVVVPNMDLIRERKIVNTGDLLRFELEGQAVHLPAHKRVLGYDIWFEPLPRTTTGKLKRHEIERQLRQKLRDRAESEVALAAPDTTWAEDAHALAAAAIIGQRSKGGAVRPDSNLELDLGLDSMERVELITELEQRFGVQVSDERAHQVLTVAQLIDAVRPGDDNVAAADAEDSWAVMLRDLPPADDPALGSLLEPRPLAAPLFLVLFRSLRLVMPKLTVTGLHHLPADGPYIICPNHQSYVDPFIINSVLPYGIIKQLFFVGAAEYFETPMTRWLAKQGNLVPVDPDANLVPAMKAGAFGLAHGKILMLFPEGERSIDGTVKRFKKGAPILARHRRVAIVPVAIRGAYEIWPRNRSFNWHSIVPFSGARVRLAFGPPLAIGETEAYGDAANRLRDAVERLWLGLSEEQRPNQQRAQDASA